MSIKKCDLSRKNLCYLTFVLSIIFFVVTILFFSFISGASSKENIVSHDKTHHIQQRKIINRLKLLENKVHKNKNKLNRLKKKKERDQH